MAEHDIVAHAVDCGCVYCRQREISRLTAELRDARAQLAELRAKAGAFDAIDKLHASHKGTLRATAWSFAIKAGDIIDDVTKRWMTPERALAPKEGRDE